MKNLIKVCHRQSYKKRRGLVGLIGLIMRPPAKSWQLYTYFFDFARFFSKNKNPPDGGSFLPN
jgi:hypothetical protein